MAHRANGRPVIQVAGIEYALGKHAVRRCAEMSFDPTIIATILREGRIRQHTPKSKHYRDGKGWIAQWQNLALGLVRDDDGAFTIVTVLWKDPEAWDDWFRTNPDTDRKRRPLPATTKHTVDDNEEQE